MKTRSIYLICWCSLIVALAACNSEPDESAVQTAIAQTRTVEDAATTQAQANESQVATSVAATVAAQSPLPTDTPLPPTPAPTDTPPPSPTDTPLPPTPVPPTATSPPTATPTTQVIAATPTPPVLLLAESLVDGDDGNDFLRGSSPNNQGRVILLPGVEQADVSDPMVFRERMVFRVEVFDTRAGLVDGAGIRDVTFQIVDPHGEVVYQRTERTAGYCAFGGGEPDCNVLVFAEAGNRWPEGPPITNGEHVAEIDIVPLEGEDTQWRWRFEIDIPGLAVPNTARITAISVQNGRYWVDFETVGFQPTLPGQHLHFFYNTVSLQDAGVPGRGPWQLYPAAPGQPNESPFTLFRVTDRPRNASQLCVLVANPNHSVNQGTGNCVDLP